MRTQSPDTPPEIEEIMIERYRRMSPGEKLRAVQDLNRTVHLMALAGIRRRHGADLSERELRLRLVAALQSNFYIDDERVRHAVQRRSSFNLLHHATGIKVDVFILKGDLHSRLEMDRRWRISPLDDDATILVASPEDIVLQKLRW